MLKKLLCGLISVTLLIMLPFDVYAAEKILSTKVYDQDISAGYLQEFLELYDDSEYGGAYIDEYGKLVVNLLEKESTQVSYIKTANSAMLTNDIDAKIDINYVEYSMEYLKSVVEAITPYMSEMGILGVGINEEKNCIELDVNKNNFQGIDSLNTVSNTSTASLMSSADEELFVINETDLTLENTATMRPGSKFNDGTDGFTVAWGAVIEHSGNNNGKEVFLIPGHSVEVNDKVYFGTTFVGKVIEQAYESYYDVAYVENTNHTMSGSFVNGESLPQGSPYTNPPQGLSLTAYGSVSGKQTGKILLTNYSFTADGKTFQGFFKTSYKAVHGDSGAPVYSSVPVGMQSMSALSNGSWVSGSYSICTSMYRLCVRNSTHWIFLKTF